MASTGSRQLEFTAVFCKTTEGYVGFVEELPGANTQGATLGEARRNLRESVQLVVEVNRALATRDVGAEEVILEAIRIPAE